MAAAPLPAGPLAPELAPDASSIRLSKLKLSKGAVTCCEAPAVDTAVVEPEKTLAVVADREPLPGAIADLLPPVAPSISLIVSFAALLFDSVRLKTVL